MKCSITISCGNNTLVQSSEYNTPLFSVLERTGFIKHTHASCGGKGVCGKCLVHASGRLNPISAEERSFIGDELADSGYRLACCCYIKGDCLITIPSQSNTSSESASSNKYGFSVDLGASRISVVLCDITTEEELDTVVCNNPQLEISCRIDERISYWQQSKANAQRLRDMLFSCLNGVIMNLINKHSIPLELIESVCIVGNTCMLHMLANIDPTPLFSSVNAHCITDNLVLKASDVGLTELSAASISICGAVSSRVGSNIVATALATGVYKSILPVIIINIESDIQVLMGNRNVLLACQPVPNPISSDSVLTCGAYPDDGVILKLWKEKYKVCYSVEGEAPPRAICLAAAFDALEIMLDVGIIDSDGNMIDASLIKPSKHRMIGKIDGKQVFFIDKKHHIYMTQQDVYLLQRIKAAILCNVEYLMEQFDIHFSDEVSAVYVCNMLGGMPRISSAVNIGMYPEMISNVCFGIGDASAQGASMLLRSPRARANAEHIRTYIKVLSKAPDYGARYQKALKLERK